LKINFHHS